MNVFTGERIRIAPQQDAAVSPHVSADVKHALALQMKQHTHAAEGALHHIIQLDDLNPLPTGWVEVAKLGAAVGTTHFENMFTGETVPWRPSYPACIHSLQGLLSSES